MQPARVSKEQAATWSHPKVEEIAQGKKRMAEAANSLCPAVDLLDRPIPKLSCPLIKQVREGL